MYFLRDIVTYVRRIIKSPSNDSIPDDLIIDYINRFYVNDVDPRVQLFDLKKKYQFVTSPGIDQYNMPLYNVQVSDTGNNSSASYPLYQGFTTPCYINGIECAFYTQKELFYKNWPNVLQTYTAYGDGGGQYVIQLPGLPSTAPKNPQNGILRGHVDISGVLSTGQNIDPPLEELFPPNEIPSTSIESRVLISFQDSIGRNIRIGDSGTLLNEDRNCGPLIQLGNAPFGNLDLGLYTRTENVINYLTGTIYIDTVNFSIPSGNNINIQYYFFQSGIPRAILFYNNTLTLRNVPNSNYLVELDAYLTPAIFLKSVDTQKYGYLEEYLARGAARKMLADTGDVEQFNFNEPLFREQELLVLKRSERQWTSTRTPSFYSQGLGVGGITNSGNYI